MQELWGRYEAMEVFGKKSQSLKSALIIWSIVAVLTVMNGFTAAEPAEAYSDNDVKCTEGVTGGCIYFDKTTGTVTDCDETVTAVSIPQSIEDVEVKAIGADAFAGCGNLQTVNISAGIKDIALPAFRGCSSLAKIEVDENNPYFVVSSGALFDVKNETLYKFPSAFVREGFCIPATVKYVAPYAFENAVNLITIDFGGTAETSMTIGEGCFDGCVNVEYVTFPQVKYKDVGTFCFEDYAFRNCKFLQSIDFPDGVTEIPHGMFTGCDELKSVCIGKNISSIAHDAFLNCPSLQSIDVEYGNEYYYYDSVAVLVNYDQTTLLRYPPAKRDTDYSSIPNTVTHISSNAFNGAVKLKSLLIPDSVQSFGEDVFAGCSGELVIRASSGSAAEKYALQNGIAFQSTGGSSNGGGSTGGLNGEESAGDSSDVNDSAAEPEKKSQSIKVNSEFSCVYGCEPFALNASAQTQLSYCINDNNVADVSADGTVSIKSPGTAIITVAASETEEYTGASRNVLVKVEKATQSIPLDCTSYKRTFAAGGAWNITIPGISSYTFKSSNSNIVKVSRSQNGKSETVEMVNPGRATITVTAKETSQYKPATRTISAYTYLKTPQVKLKRYAGGKIRISWSAVPGAQKYQVYVYDSKKKKYILRLTKSSNVKAVVHRGLKQGKTYRYKIRAYRVVGGKKVYSEFSTAKKTVARK